VANTTDPQSGILKTRRGWVQGYNAQAVVTTGQIILAADVTTEANDVRQRTGMLDQAQANVEAVLGEEAVLGAAVADAGYWSEANADSQTEECELFIATQKDHKQRAALREAPAPRGRIPKSMTVRERMDRKLRTKRGRALYRKRGASVEPVFGQMKDRQDAGRFSMRGLELCRGEWQLQAAVQSWLGESGQKDKWIFRLTAAIIAVLRRDHDQTTAAEPHAGIQSQSGIGRPEGREDIDRAGASL